MSSLYKINYIILLLINLKKNFFYKYYIKIIFIRIKILNFTILYHKKKVL